MRVLVLHRQQSAVGYYRQWIPARALARAGHEVTWQEEHPWFKRPQLEDWIREVAARHDVLLVDREVDPRRLGLLVGLRHLMPDGRMVVDYDDDFTNVPPWNLARGDYNPGQAAWNAATWHMMWAEMTTVTTSTLADRFRPKSHAIRVVPNVLDPADWEGHPVNPEREADPAFRIFYGGASGHYGDLDVVRTGLERFLLDPPAPVRLICFGTIPKWLHDLRRRHPARVILCRWVPFRDYPAAVAWGGFDLAIAPLAEHPFNEAKSAIKALEAGIQGVPFLGSRVGPYRDLPSDAFFTLPNDPDAWYDFLREAVRDPGPLRRAAKRAREFVLDVGTVARAAPLWEDVIEDVRSRPRIESVEMAEALPHAGSPDADATGEPDSGP